MRLRCQVCGGLIPAKADGMVALHYRRSAACRGSGRLPYEQDDSALREAVVHYRDLDKRYSAIFYAHHEARKNEPLRSSFSGEWAAVVTMSLRLSNRLKRRAKALGVPMAPEVV